MSTVRATLRELSAIAVEQVGGCLALFWEGGRLDRGAARPICYRLVHVLFRSRREALAFHDELARRNLSRLGRHAVGELTVYDHLGMLRGWAATAVVSPSWDSPVGLHVVGIPAGRQPGVAAQAARREAAWLAEDRRSARRDGDDELGAVGSHEPTDRLQGHFALLEPEAEPDALDERLAERLVERDLAAVEREVDAHLARDPRYFQSFAELWAHVDRRCRFASRERVEQALGDADARAAREEQARLDRQRALGSLRRATREERLRQDAEEVREAARRRRRGEAAEWLELKLELRRKGHLPAVGAAQQLADELELAALAGQVA